MYVSNEVRRNELPDNTRDASPYATAASGASFMAILTEVGRAPETQPTDDSTPDVESSPAGTDGQVEGSTKVSESPSNSEAEAPENDVEEHPAPSTDETSPEVATEASVPIEALPSVVDTVAASGATPLERAFESSIAEAVKDSPTIATESSSVTKEKLVVAPAPVKPLEAEKDSAKSSITIEALDGITGSPDDSAVETANPPQPAPPVNFPKTLNAIIAEGAVRQAPEIKSAGDDVNIDSVAPTDVIAENGNEPVPPKPHIVSQLPQAAALEIGGVRPETTASPRLPMANLPGELAQQIHLMQQEGTRSMRLRLVPENLGDLQIEISGKGDSLRVHLVSSNPVVRSALESQMGDLKDAMQKQGLLLDNASVGAESAQRDPTPQPQKQRESSPIRTANTAGELPPSRIRTQTSLALGSSALNILA